MKGAGIMMSMITCITTKQKSFSQFILNFQTQSDLQTKFAFHRFVSPLGIDETPMEMIVFTEMVPIVTITIFIAFMPSQTGYSRQFDNHIM